MSDGTGGGSLRSQASGEVVPQGAADDLVWYLDTLAYQLGLSDVLADDGQAGERIAAALRRASELLKPGCGRLDWCDACYRHVPHGELRKVSPLPEAPSGASKEGSL